MQYFGESGSGKTTLLNVIGGLDKVNNGNIYINGKKINKRLAYTVDKIRNLNVGYIFQDYKLIDNISVFENVAMALKMIGIKDKAEIKQKVECVLSIVKMDRYKNRPAAMLSGGERQRVAIARAIVKNPNIIIADEPTGNLDSKNSLEIMNIIKAISKDKLVILVTHETNLADFYASRIIKIKDGKIEKDYVNDSSGTLDYRVDNKIYLKDLEDIQKINYKKLNMNIYADDEAAGDVNIAIKNGNIYIKTNGNKVEVLDENSNIEFVNEHYKEVNKQDYQEYQYDLSKINNQNKKMKYASINGILRSILNGIKKIADYTILKKILLLGFFASSMFIVYAVCNITGIQHIEESEFITMNKNYLQVEMESASVDKFLEYEKLACIDYIIPGDSMVSFKMKFDKYYQTARNTVEITGSLVSDDKISEENLIQGRMPENEYEIVVDKKVIDNAINGDGIGRYMGVKDISELLNKNVSIDKMKDFTIVGIVDDITPTIYAKKSIFINLLNSSQTRGNTFFSMDVSEENTDGEILDYSLYLDDITLTKGRMPEADYEVIVNKVNQDQMKLNKTIKTKVNGKELKVVGYYESKTNRQSYLVNQNTVKYNVITNKNGMIIYPKNESETIQILRNGEKLNLFNRYERDKENYINKKQESITSTVIFAGTILAISLIEIYLMTRASFLSRIKEIGVLRAIGVKKLDIYKMFLGEILAITTLAGMPGVILMTYILKAITKVSYMSKMYIVSLGTVGTAILIIYGFNLLVGLLPLFKVLRKRPARILARHDVD